MSQLPGRPITIEEIRRLAAPTIADMSKRELVRTIQAGVFGGIIISTMVLLLFTALAGFALWGVSDYLRDREISEHGYRDPGTRRR